MERLRQFMDKKGIAVSTIIVLIIIVVGFAILLLFYSQIAWTGNIDRAVCHQSVVYRATLPDFANSKDLVPLKCRTEKVCITSDMFGKCSEFEGSGDVTRVRVKDSKDIEQFIAQDMLGCWETMGRGELSLFNNFLVESYSLGSVSSSCVICSRIAFDDESLSEAEIDRESVDVFNYMLTHKVPNEEISYYEKILGSAGRMNLNLEKRNQENLVSVADNSGGDSEIVFDQVESDEMAILFMQVTSPDHWDVFKNTAATLGIGALGTSVVPGGKTVLKAVFRNPLVALVAIVGGASLQQYSVYLNREVTASYCGDVKVGDESREGCSVVRTIPYDVGGLSQFCGKIESIS